MTRRNWLLAGAGILIVVAVGCTVAATGSSEDSPTTQENQPNTAKVAKGDLSALVSVNGTLTYVARSDGSPYVAINQARGTFTDLPAAGDKVDCGDVFYRVDDRPVLLLCGDVPAYRDLSVGAAGKDVRQLNRNLEVEGDMFTAQTQNALADLQRDKGLDATGALGLDDAIFLPASLRISNVTATVGGPAQPGQPIAEATSSTVVVRADLEASQQGKIKKGDQVQVTLPSNQTTKGKVDRIGNAVQTTGQDKEPGPVLIPAYITLDQPADAQTFGGSGVRVDITTAGVQNVLSVPVTALVGHAGGGYAVEVIRSSGNRVLVAVKLGQFDTTGGRVEVDGDLAEGDDVVVPKS